MDRLEALLDLVYQRDEVDAGTAAGRAGDEVRGAGRVTEAFENIPGGVDLPHRVGGQGDADGLADAVQEEAADAGGRFDEAHPLGAGFGDAEVEGVGAAGGQHPVGGNHRPDVGGLEGDDNLVKIAVFQKPHMVKAALDQRFGGRAAEAGEDFLFDRAGVDADADRDAPGGAGPGNLPDVAVVADVAGVDADFVDAGGQRFQRQPVVKVDVGNQRDGDSLFDLRDQGDCRLVRDCDPEDFAAGRFQRLGLADVAFDVGTGDREHRLDIDMAAVQRQITDPDRDEVSFGHYDHLDYTL